MLRILIADDEPHHRRGLTNMINKLRPDYKTYEARNGKEALEFVKSNTIDIVIVDIKMPIMDGFQFIEEIGNRINKLKVIILSAYDYFEYAKKALSFGVFDYVLKPVDENAIIGMLEKVEKSIREDRIKEEQRELMEEQLDNALPIYINHQLNKWIHGILPRSKIKDIAAIIPDNGIGIVSLVRFIYSKAAIGRYSLNEMDEIRINIKDWFTQALGNLGYVCSFDLDDDNNIVVFVISSIKDSIEIPDPSTRKALEEVIECVKTTYEIDTTVAFGCICSDIYNEIKCSFEQALEAVDYDFFIGDNKVVSFNQYGDFLDISDVDLYEREEILIQALREENIKAVRNIIDDIFFNMTIDGYPSPSWCIDVITSFVTNIAYKFDDLTAKESYCSYVKSMHQQLKKSRTYADLKNGVIALMDNIINEMHDRKENDKYDLIIQKCLCYINDHYMDDISLSSVARMFYFNPNYFSSFFRMHIGQTFSQYLLKVRLQKACELLAESDYRVYDIAAKVGYKDVKYFNRVFKSEYKVTPDEYRRLIVLKKVINNDGNDK